METIPLIYEDFTNIRRTQNLMFYSRQEGNYVKLFAIPKEGIIISAELHMNSSEWNRIKTFANKPIKFYDRRVVSHDFANKNTWSSIDNSMFTCTPDPGWKFILTHCIVRFPKTLMLTDSNALHYLVYLSLDGKSEPVPVIHIEYKETADLIRKTNTPMYVSPTNLPGMGEEAMVEINFVYADPFTFDGAPVTFRSSLNERIEIYLESNEEFVDINNLKISQECNIMLNFKRTLEF